VVEVDPGHRAAGYRYDDQAVPGERLCGTHLNVRLVRREYLLLKPEPRAFTRPR